MEQNIGWAGEILDVKEGEFEIKPNTKYGYDRAMDLRLNGVKTPLDNPDSKGFNVCLIGVKLSIDKDCNLIIDGYDEAYIVDDDGGRVSAVPLLDGVTGDMFYTEKKEDSVLYYITFPDDEQ